MRTVPVDKFIPYISVQAENCPNFLVRQCVLATVSDMCQRTGCVTTETCFSTKAGERRYDLQLGTGLRGEIVRHLYVDGKELTPVTLDELSHIFKGVDWAESSGEPMFYTYQKPGEIQIIPVPQSEAFCRVALTASVERDAEKVPEQFYNDYFDAVLWGALSRVFRVAGQTYTNVRLADEYEMKYDLAVRNIRNDVVRDFTRRSGRVFFNKVI